MILPEPFKAKVLLTGASGFVGGRLREALIAAGADVVAIRRASSPEPKEGRSVVADYEDVPGLVKVLEDEQPAYLFHVAGATKGVSYRDFQNANVLPTRHLLEATKQSQVALKRFMLVSSLTAYGPSSPSAPLREDDEPRPIEHYGRSKLEAEQVLENVAGEAVPWTIIRPGGVYGPGDYDYFNLFREAHAGRNVFFGNQERLFSAVYVDDCVRAAVAAACSDKTVGRGYFICDGQPTTWKHFQDMIVTCTKRPARTLNLPEFLVPMAAFGGELLTKLDGKPRLFNRQKAKMGAQAAWTCRHDAAKNDFGYAPEVPLDDGIRRSVNWYRSAGWLS